MTLPTTKAWGMTARHRNDATLAVAAVLAPISGDAAVAVVPEGLGETATEALELAAASTSA